MKEGLPNFKRIRFVFKVTKVMRSIKNMPGLYEKLNRQQMLIPIFIEKFNITSKISDKKHPVDRKLNFSQ